MNYDPTNASGGPSFSGSVAGAEQSFVSRVFNWMFLGLGLTGIVAYFISSNPVLMRAIVGNMMIFFVIAIGGFALVWNLAANAHKMSPSAAMFNFFLYAGLNGVILSTIFVVYTQASIVGAFLISSVMFGVTALYGYTTKKDLSSLGSLAFMGLIGIIIASVVNWFLHSTMMEMLISYIGVAVFVGLTAYDMQKIKQIGQSGSYHPNLSIRAALTLYLDFVNMFLFILRIMGRRR